MARKKALLVGINYTGMSHALRGCINDVKTMKNIVANELHFDEVRVVLDHDATTAEIKRSLKWLVDGAMPGDTLFFHYSGHGSQMVDSKFDKDLEPDGLDEIICPIDLDWRNNVIRDDDLRAIFDRVPNGVHLTVLLDCCNSGSGLDHENIYQPLGLAKREVMREHGDVTNIRSRFLPPPPNVAYVAENKSLDFYKPRSLQSRDVNKTGLLISGCQPHQTSADAYIGGKYMGACTFMVSSVLKQHDYKIDYKTLVEEINKRLKDAGFTQRPELNGPGYLFTKKFLRESDDDKEDHSSGGISGFIRRIFG